MSEKWWDMSDDELDDLFREASDKVEIPFDSSALDKLRQKIESKSMPKPEPSQGFKKRWIALAGLLIFFGVALLYTFYPKKVNSVESKQANISHKEIKGEKNLKELGNLPNNKKSEVIVDENNSSKTKESKGNSINRSVIESKNVQNKNSTIIANPTNKTRYGLADKKGVKRAYSLNKNPLNQEISKSISENNVLKNKPLDISNTKSIDKKTPTAISNLNGGNLNLIKGENNSSEVNSPIVSYAAKTDKKQSRLPKAKVNSNQFNNPSVYQETNLPISTPIIIPENKPVEEATLLKTNFYNVDFLTNKATKSLETNIETESPTYVDAPPIVMKQPKFSRFGIRLAIAPDINSLEKLGTSVLGSSFGLLFEYRLNKKFIIQTGVTYSSKKYIGDFDYYHSWAGNWAAYHPSKPIDVDGGCKIIDVPLNIRFNIYQKPRSTFFISTGVSSYFMMNETYTYDYAWSPSKTVTWSDKSSFYWSALNLSAGVERKLNKHLTFQVEPYLKTPLTNVGRGGVNLYSSGLLFSTKYEF